MTRRFNEIPNAPLDPIMQANAQWKDFKVEFDDPINTTVGVLIDPESETPWQPVSVKDARKVALNNISEQGNFGYQPPAGHEQFLAQAAKFVLGKDQALSDVSIYQTLGGTGALSLAKDVLVSAVASSGSDKMLYLDGGWPNHQAIFNEDFEVVRAPRLDEDGNYDHAQYLEWLYDTEDNPVILLQACGYNDDGMDRTVEQWDEIIAVAKEKEATLIIDAAYLGLAQTPEVDRYAISAAIQKELFTLVCVSTSKNMGLYNQRLGALFVANAEAHMGNQQSKNPDQLAKRIIRKTVSNMPLLAPHAASVVLGSDEYRKELDQARKGVRTARAELGEVLKEVAPNVSAGYGLFTKLKKDGFSESQQAYLRTTGILALPNSRINIGGIAPSKIQRVGTVLLDTLRIK